MNNERSTGPSAAAVLEVTDLTVERADRRLFANLSLTAAAGEIIHLSGANGCGKTTLLRTLAGLVEAAAGDVRWHGNAADAGFADSLTYIGHAAGVSAELSARENLDFAARLVRVGDPGVVDHALRHFGLGAVADQPAARLSAGQRQRVALCRLLLAPRPLWMLDEPFTSLDTDGRALLTAAIDQHVAADGVVLIATHQAFDTRAVQRVIELEDYA